MPQTPNWDITYPASDGHTRIWEHLEELAWNVETAMNIALNGGHYTIRTFETLAGPSGASSFTKVVTYPSPFMLAPIVLVNLQSGAGATAQWNERVIAAGTTTCTLFGFGPSPSTFDATYKFVAIGAVLL